MKPPLPPSRHYQGRGTRRAEPAADLPVVDPGALGDPAGYLAGPDLAAAVDVALTLGMPLLLTGEPGIGKSRLAHSIAWELRLGDPLVFSVKSDTQGRDLFYTFDTLGRFHAAQAEGEDADPRRFLTFNALGKALLLAKGGDGEAARLGPAWEALGHGGTPRRSVVLIDEIDKAPRDVPNDLLTEIEEMRFRIPELSAVAAVKGHGQRDEFRLEPGENRYRPVVIITSNSEKGLPDPFLRRCVYHHLAFPPYRGEAGGGTAAVTVEDIVETRLYSRYRGGGETLVQDAIELFRHLRAHALAYRPSLAELLNWLDYLLPGDVRGATLGRLADIDPVRRDAGIRMTLLKNAKAQGEAERIVQEWLKR